MKIKKIHAFVLLAVWSASCGAAFYVGRVSLAPQTAGERQASSGGAARGQTTAANSASARSAANFNWQAALNGSQQLDRDLLEEWADGLDPAQMAALIEDLQKLPAGERRDDVIEQIVDSWSQRDPKGFLAARDKISNPRTREGGVADALRSLAEADPKAAMAWLAESSDAVPNQLLARRYREAIQGIAGTDPAAAMDLIKQMGTATPADQQIKNQSLNALVDTLSQGGRYGEALQAFSALSPEDRTAASARVLGRWADNDPEAASTYIAGVEDPAQRSQMAGRVAQSWARNDPQAAATWAASFELTQAQATGQSSGQVLADAIRTWSFFDLNGPAQFLNTLPKGPSTDQAITAFTMQARNMDPASAMNWANNISDADTRQRVTSAVALQWLATDPTGFSQNASNMNSFTDQQKQFMNFLSQNPEALTRINQRINTEGLDSLRGFNRGGPNNNPNAAAPANNPAAANPNQNRGAVPAR